MAPDTLAVGLDIHRCLRVIRWVAKVQPAEHEAVYMLQTVSNIYETGVPVKRYCRSAGPQEVKAVEEHASW